MKGRPIDHPRRDALHRDVRKLIESGSNILALAPALGFVPQHAYRIAKAAGVQRFYLTPDERRIIEARRQSFRTI